MGSNWIIRADFCFANIWESQPSFPRQNLEIDRSLADSGIVTGLLDPKDTFGLSSPILNVVTQIRYLTSRLDHKTKKLLDRMNLSNGIYHLEYDLLVLNQDETSLSALAYPLTPFEFSLKTAIHIFLHLFIREIPSSSQAIGKMALRLRTSLESSLYDWWNADSEYQTWLLWILFAGYLACEGILEQREWFLGNLGVTSDLLGICDGEGLRGRLEMVLWVEEFKDGIGRIWGSIEGTRDVSLKGCLERVGCEFGE